MFNGYLINNGKVWSAGFNGYGQLGLDDNNAYLIWQNTHVDASEIIAGSYFAYVNYPHQIIDFEEASAMPALAGMCLNHMIKPQNFSQVPYQTSIA